MTQERLQVLVVDGAIPERDASAGERATFDQIEGLAELGHDVTFCALGDRGDRGDGHSHLDAISATGASVPVGSGGGLTHLRDVVTRHDWDVIIVHRPGPALAATAALPLRPNAATIYWGHDIHIWRLRAQQLVTHDVPRHQYRVTEVSEQRCWNSYDVTAYPTSREAHAISARPDSLGRGAAAPYYRLVGDDLVSRVGRAGARHGCLMVGSSAHAPNRDAVIFAVREVLPMLRDSDPDAALTVVGDWPVELTNQLRRTGVTFVGRVSDSELKRLHATHLCLLAPLRFGAGARRKLVAAMGLGLPVITTSEGVRGLLVRDAVPGDGVLIADEPREIADAVIDLKSSPELWQDTAVAARGSVGVVYAAESFDRALTQVLERAVTLHTRQEQPFHA
jgi:hypothetical protein